MTDDAVERGARALSRHRHGPTYPTEDRWCVDCGRGAKAVLDAVGYNELVKVRTMGTTVVAVQRDSDVVALEAENARLRELVAAADEIAAAYTNNGGNGTTRELNEASTRRLKTLARYRTLRAELETPHVP